MPTSDQPQTALDERVIESDELAKALEDREQAKGTKSEATSKFKTLDEVVKDKVEELGLEEDEAVRCGRFRISKRAVGSRSVSFETSPASRVTISAIEDE